MEISHVSVEDMACLRHLAQEDFIAKLTLLENVMYYFNMYSTV
jgi:hypothetical protein